MSEENEHVDDPGAEGPVEPIEGQEELVAGGEPGTAAEPTGENEAAMEQPEAEPEPTVEQTDPEPPLKQLHDSIESALFAAQDLPDEGEHKSAIAMKLEEALTLAKQALGIE